MSLSKAETTIKEIFIPEDVWQIIKQFMMMNWALTTIADIDIFAHTYFLFFQLLPLQLSSKKSPVF